MKAAHALVVDDDPGTLEVLEMRLQFIGLDAALARSFREAITLLDDHDFDVALFDLIFTTKDSGTGLGMAIARTVVEQHGGRMDIRSQIGRGTQVRVLLPTEAS